MNTTFYRLSVLSKTPRFYVFRVVISAKICHHFVHLALAAISFTLRRIFGPFHILKWRFSLPLVYCELKKGTPFGPKPPRINHYRECPSSVNTARRRGSDVVRIERLFDIVINCQLFIHYQWCIIWKKKGLSHKMEINTSERADHRR